MGEIRPKTCEQGKDRRDQLALGAAIVQAPEELRSLKRELLGGKRGNLDRPVGRLRISVMQGRDLKDVRLKFPAHSFKNIARSMIAAWCFAGRWRSAARCYPMRQ